MTFSLFFSRCKPPLTTRIGKLWKYFLVLPVPRLFTLFHDLCLFSVVYFIYFAVSRALLNKMRFRILAFPSHFFRSFFPLLLLLYITLIYEVKISKVHVECELSKF